MNMKDVLDGALMNDIYAEIILKSPTEFFVLD